MKSKFKLTTVAIVAFLVGAFVTLLLSIFSGFSLETNAPTSITEVSAEGYTLETFYIDLGLDPISATHDGDKPIPAMPQGIPLLEEENIRRGFLLTTKLRDANGTIIGFTSEQEVISADSNLMQGKMKMEVSWTLTIPGRGTIFLAQQENGSEFVKTVVIPTMLGGEDFIRPADDPYILGTTVGPNPDGSGVIVGGSGEFTGITGKFVEVAYLTKFTTDKVFGGTVQLQLAYKLPENSTASK